MVDRDRTGLEDGYRPGGIYDSLKSDTPTYSTQTLRTDEDQQMDTTGTEGRSRPKDWEPEQIAHTDKDGTVTYHNLNKPTDKPKGFSEGGIVGEQKPDHVVQMVNGTPTWIPMKKPWILERAKNWVSGLRNADKIGINPKDALGAAKVPMHLVPPSSTILQAFCMDDGNIKYGPYNVRMENIQAIGYISAAKRHLDAYMDGQDFDSVTGKPHLGYALATIGLVIDAWLNGTLIDNRPVPGVGGQLLDELAMKPGEEARDPETLKAIFERVAEFGKQQTELRRSHKE